MSTTVLKPRLVERVLEILKQEVVSLTDWQDAILGSVLLFDTARGIPTAGLINEMDQFDVSSSQQERSDLKQAFVEFSRETTEDNHFTEALWALGRAHDKDLVPYFREALQRAYAQYPQALFQALINLEDAGEPVFGNHTSHSIIDSEENRQFAQAYLQSLKLI